MAAPAATNPAPAATTVDSAAPTTFPRLSKVITALIVLNFLVMAGVIVYKVLYPPTPLDCRIIRGRQHSSIGDIETMYCKSLPPLPPKIVGPLPSWECQLPYVNNREYLEALSLYTCTYPSATAMVVWGPKSTGKSGGINQMKRIWDGQARMVLDIDLKTYSNKPYSSYQALFKSVLVEALDSARLHASVLVYCKICSSFHHDDINYDVGTSFLETQVDGVLSLVSPEVLQAIRMSNAEWSSDVYIYIAKLFRSRKDGGPASGTFESILEFLDLLTLQRPDLAPIVILREIQFLNNMGGDGKEALREIIDALEKQKQKSRIVPIIIETSDYLWINTTNLLRSKGSFSPYYVGLMDYETLTQELVNELKVFTVDEWRKVWFAAGGHPGSIDAIFRRKLSQGIDQAIASEQTYTYQIVAGRVNNSPRKAEVMQVLRTLYSAQNSQLCETSLRPAVKELLECNILRWGEAGVIEPQNEMIKHAILAALAAKVSISPSRAPYQGLHQNMHIVL